MQEHNKIEDDKLIHSAVGLGIKLGAIYSFAIGLITMFVTHFFGLTLGLLILIALTGLVIYRGAYLAGIIKELIDKYIRKSKYDTKDAEATQNSNIVINWYKDKIN